MVPDRKKVRTDGMDGRTHGRRQNYIPPTSSGDNRYHLPYLADTLIGGVKCSYKMTNNL